MNLAKAYTNVKALTGYSSHAVADMMNDDTWVPKSDVLAAFEEGTFAREVPACKNPLHPTEVRRVPNERKGQRRGGMEIVGTVEERYPNGARDTLSVFRYSGLLTWLKNNRSEVERRGEE